MSNWTYSQRYPSQGMAYRDYVADGIEARTRTSRGRELLQSRLRALRLAGVEQAH